MSLHDIITDIMVNTGLRVNNKKCKEKNIIHLDDCPFCHNGKSNRPRSLILYDGNYATFYCHKGSCPSGGSMNLGILADCLNYSKGKLAYYKFLNNGNYNNTASPEPISKKINMNYDKIDVSKELHLITGSEYDITLNCTIIDDKIKKYLKDKRHITQDCSNIMLKNSKNGNLIIPYYNKTLDNIYYLQERSSSGQYFFLKPKEYDNEEFIFKKIYNLYNVNDSKEIIAFEGVMDTFFVENSISIGGAKNVAIIDKLKFFYNSDKIFYIQDNDKAGKDSAIKYIQNGGYAFQWYKFLRDYNINTSIKDVNDLYIKNIFKDKLNFKILQEYFTNNLIFEQLI